MKNIDISKMKEKGLLGGEIFNIDRDYLWGAAIPHDSLFVDPFVKGKLSVTIDHWTTSIDDEFPENIIIKGGPLHYVSNNKNILLLIYAGPDGDIDNINLELQNDTITPGVSSGITSLRYLQSYIPYVNINGLNLIQYDPTNGLMSNGDVVWGIYRSPDWMLSQYRIY
jgi:hypothetical protein